MNAVAGTRGPGSTDAAPRVARHRVAALGLQFLHLGWFASTLDAGFDPGALAASGVASALLYSGSW